MIKLEERHKSDGEKQVLYNDSETINVYGSECWALDA